MKIKNADGEWVDISKIKLMPCPDCGRDVSSKAAMRPHCGRKLKTDQTAIGLLAAIIIGLEIGLLIFRPALCSH